jgi:hypothetical protein
MRERGNEEGEEEQRMITLASTPDRAADRHRCSDGVEASEVCRGADVEALGDEIARLAAHVHAATYRLLELLRAFDEAGGCGGGFRSCAQWLSWRTGIGPGPAREKVRVARALGALPRISEAMAGGELSYSKVRALTRVATGENEGELLEVGRQGTASQVERLVRVWRSADRQEAGEVEGGGQGRRYLELHPEEDGSWGVRGRLDPEVGAVLEKALAWAGEALYRRAGGAGGTGGAEGPRAGQRRADAVGLVAERALAVVEGEEGEEGAGRDGGETLASLPVGRAERFGQVPNNV